MSVTVASRSFKGASGRAEAFDMWSTRLAGSIRTVAVTLATVGILAAVVSGIAVASHRDNRIDHWLAERGQVVETTAEGTVKTAVDGLRSVAAYFEHSDHVTPDEFFGFTDTLDPSITLMSVGFVRVVGANEVDEYLQQRRRADPDFAIREIDGSGDFVPTDRVSSVYFPVELVNPGVLLEEPLIEAGRDPRHLAIGFDVGSESEWRSSLELAVRHDTATVSDFFEVEVGDVALGRAFVVAVPVHGASGEVTGLVVAPMVDRLLTTRPGGMAPEDVSWTIDSWEPVPEKRDLHSWTTLIVLPGTVWELEVEPTPEALAALAGIPPWAVGVALLAVTLMAVLAFVLFAQRSAQRTQVAELERIATEKDRFLASVAHEIRTPLTVVAGLAHELRDHPGAFDPVEAAELLELLCSQSEEVAVIVEDLLVAARADLGLVNVSSSPVDLRLEAARVVGDIPIRIPETTVWAWADPQRVRQIVRNLVTNAQRYGGPDIEVRCGADHETVWVEVADSGPPIPAGEQARIFQPYVSTASDSHPGVAAMGLGLFISQRLGELLGGGLTYHHDGRFSVFRLTLPASPVVIRPAESAA